MFGALIAVRNSCIFSFNGDQVAIMFARNRASVLDFSTSGSEQEEMWELLEVCRIFRTEVLEHLCSILQMNPISRTSKGNEDWFEKSKVALDYREFSFERNSVLRRRESRTLKQTRISKK